MNKIATIGIAVSAAANSVLAGEINWDALNRQAYEESLIPVALPARDNIPFWNRNARRFIHPPAFEIAPVDGIRKYRFELTDDDGKVLAAFEAENPQEPLTAVWKELPVQLMRLNVYPINADGSKGESIFYKRFYRSAWFKGPYPVKNQDYTAAAYRCFSYIYHLEHVQNWETVDDTIYRKYCYPSKTLPAIIDAMLIHAEYDGREEVKANALRIAEKMVEWLICNSQAPGTPLEYLPPTYFKDTTYHVCRRHVGEIMMIYPMRVGLTYLKLYKLTGKQKYLDSALKIAATMKKLELPQGSWYLVYSEADGKPKCNNVVLINESMYDFLTELTEITGNKEYTAMRDRAFRILYEKNLKEWNWDGQFEDTTPLPQYDNLTKDGALFVARKKLEEGDIATAEKIIAWAEDQFVVWSDPCPEGRFSDTWILPGALEQYQCYMPIDASYARFIDIYSFAFIATGKQLYMEKAKALADCIIRNQRDSGEIPTFFQVSHYMTWLNCMERSAEVLLMLDERIKTNYNK